jgi:beta-lactamase class A
VLLLAAFPATLTAQEDVHRKILSDNFRTALEEVVLGYDGVAGAHVIDLTSGESWDVRGDVVFPQASAIKVAILLELFRRAEAEPGLLRKRVELTAAVRTGGSGVLHHLTDGGSALSLEDHAIYMIVFSDNTSTNVLIDELGMDAINRLTASLGAPNTKVQRKMIQPEASARGDENISTPREAAMLMRRISTCDLPMSQASCGRVTEILEIPKTGPMRAPVPSNVRIAFKPGGITGVSTAWAFVQLRGRPYALAVMATYGGDGDAVVEGVSRAAYSYFSRLAGATPWGTRVDPALMETARPPS